MIGVRAGDCVAACHGHGSPSSTFCHTLHALRLQVRIGGKWGTVCATKPTGFSVTAAQAVCASLNMTGGRPRFGAAFGRGSLPILLSNMHCASSTTPLEACVYGGKARGCTHANDVGVVCKGEGALLLGSPGSHDAAHDGATLTNHRCGATPSWCSAFLLAGEFLERRHGGHPGGGP